MEVARERMEGSSLECVVFSSVGLYGAGPLQISPGATKLSDLPLRNHKVHHHYL